MPFSIQPNIKFVEIIYSLSRALSAKITDTNEMANAAIPMTATILIKVSDFSKAVRLRHQLGFLEKKCK